MVVSLRRSLVFFLALILVVCSAKISNKVFIDEVAATPAQKAQLQQIRDNIQKHGAINAASVGVKLTAQINLAFHSDGVTVGFINATLTDTSLIVTGKARVWNATVVGTFTFFFPTATSTDVQLQLQFGTTFDVANVYKAVFPSDATPNFLAGVRATEQASVVLSTFAYNSYPAGLSVSTTSILVSPSSNVLVHALSTLNSAASSATYKADLYVPLFTANPTYVDLKLNEQGSFALTDNLHVSDYQLSVSVSGATSFALSADLAVSVKNQAQPVTFAVSTQWKANTTLTFSGSLTSAWNQPFGVHWFSISSGSISFDVSTPAKTERLSISGVATFSFAPSARSTFSLVLLNSGDFAVSVSGVPVGSAGALYSAVTGSARAPAILGGIALNGDVSFTLASFTSGSVTEGLTIDADVTLDFGSTLDKAAKTLASSPQKFSLSLFIPVYSSNVNQAKFSLAASGSFGLTRSISISGYQISVAIASQTTITISATAHVALEHQAQPLIFNIASNWQDYSLTTFQGSLQGSWQHPFGFSWLQFVSSVSLQLSISAGQSSSAEVSISGTGTVASAPSSPFSFAINVQETGNWYFTVSNFPLGTLPSFYGSVHGSTPALLHDTSLTGQASLAIASYSAGNVAQGLTVSAVATVTGTLGKAAAAMGVASSQTYKLSLFLPVLGAQGNPTLSFSESGNIALASHVQLNSYSIRVTFSSTPDIALGGQVSISIPDQAQPAVVQINAEWNEQSSTTSFSGKLSSWTHPLGLKWLSFQDLSVNLVLSSAHVTQLSFSGQASLTFATSPVTATISFDSLGNVVLSVSNIPINTLIFLYQDVTRANPPDYMMELNTLEGTVSFTVATANSGSAKRGFSLSAQVHLLEGTLSKAVKTFVSSPSERTFELDLFIPIFDANPEAISLSLTESGNFRLSSTIEVQSYGLSLAVSGAQHSTAISLSAQVAISLAHQSHPVVFSVSGRWNSGTSVSFNGQLVGQWPSPFGAHWLDITGAAVQLVVNEAVVQSLGFSGAATLTFDSSTVDTSFAISTANNFVDNTFLAEVDAKWSLGQITHSLTGRSPSLLSDVNANSASLSIVLSTYAHDAIKTGLTVQTKGTITGELLKRVKALQSHLVGGMQWSVGLNIPLFTSDPADISISLEVDSEFNITPHLTYEKLALEVDAFPLAISADSQLKATFTKNPPLRFDIGGQFSADGSVLLSGDMMGTWENVFGFHGFDVSDVILEIGFNPAMCVVDGACLSDLGIGFNMSMGTKTIAFDGNVASPDFEDIFVRGAIAGSNGMALTMLDVVLEWNKIFPHWKIPTKDVPANWGLADTSFSFAPKDGTFGGITYQEGFAFNGGIRLLDMDLSFNIDCSPRYTTFCDFSINVHLDWDLFYHMIKREVELRNLLPEAELAVFSLDSLSLTQWSAKDYSAGILPRWQIGLTVFGKKHHLDFEVAQWELASSFSGFFTRWLKHVF